MRYSYTEVFRVNSDGSVTPNSPVQFGGISMGPGVTFTRGTAFGGVDIASLQGHAIEADFVNGVYLIKGFY